MAGSDPSLGPYVEPEEIHKMRHKRFTIDLTYDDNLDKYISESNLFWILFKHIDCIVDVKEKNVIRGRE